jgi:hypothetical protein
LFDIGVWGCLLGGTVGAVKESEAIDEYSEVTVFVRESANLADEFLKRLRHLGTRRCHDGQMTLVRK